MAAIIEVKVPDIGGFADVPVIEVHVAPGAVVKAEDALITLESDKATMDVPAPAAGTVKELKIKLGDKVSEGTLILTLEAGQGQAAAPAPTAAAPAPAAAVSPTPAAPATAAPAAAPQGLTSATPGPASALADFRPTEHEPTVAPDRVHMPSPAEVVNELSGSKAHASPSVRRYARELGVDVTQVKGTGPKGRITQADVQSFVKAALAGGVPAAASAGGGVSGSGTLNLLPWPQVDFAKFGPVEVQPLSRIKKISGANLARNWVMIPHVTQFDEADIGALEAFRVALNKENEKAGTKVTMLAFLIKAVVAALKKYPQFNASLTTAENGEMSLVLKQYFHIGFAADTPNGLVVPVLRDADRKGVLDIARETAELAARARDGKLLPTEMQGGCFSISSLGGIGGTAFTPIINAPEVAILGVSKSETKPKWNGREFEPRLMLPLSLSYDHRVIDGAAAARFTTYLGQLLADMRRTML